MEFKVLTQSTLNLLSNRLLHTRFHQPFLKSLRKNLTISALTCFLENISELRVGLFSIIDVSAPEQYDENEPVRRNLKEKKFYFVKRKDVKRKLLMIMISHM